MDDAWADEEESLANTTTEDKDGHTDEERTQEQVTHLRTPRMWTKVADDEPHDSDCEPKEDTTVANPQDLSDQDEIVRDGDTTSSFDSVPQDEAEDALEP